MTDQTPDQPTVPPPSPRLALVSRVVAVVALAGLCGAIAATLIGTPRAVIGAAGGAGLLAFAAWGPLVLAARGPVLGAAAIAGLLALFGAYVGALVVGSGASALRDPDALTAVVFSLWIVAPMVVTLAVAVALVTRLLATRDA